MGGGVMEIFKTKDGKIITYEEDKATVVDVDELKRQKESFEREIAAVVIPTDKQLLAWAKQTYPIKDVSVAQIELERINLALSKIE